MTKAADEVWASMQLLQARTKQLIQFCQGDREPLNRLHEALGLARQGNPRHGLVLDCLMAIDGLSLPVLPDDPLADILADLPFRELPAGKPYTAQINTQMPEVCWRDATEAERRDYEAVEDLLRRNILTEMEKAVAPGQPPSGILAIHPDALADLRRLAETESVPTDPPTLPVPPASAAADPGQPSAGS